jgi:hypothetical protein
MADASDSSILKDCYNCLLLEVSKYEPRNFVVRVRNMLRNLGTEHSVNLPFQMQFSQFRLNLFNNLAAGIIASLLTYYSSDFPFLNVNFGCAVTYLTDLPRHKARTLLMIRCNSLFKPFQYLSSSFCILCGCGMDDKKGWDILLHFYFDCPHFAKERHCAQLRQTNDVDCLSCLTFSDQVDEAKLQTVGTILSTSWTVRKVFQQAIKHEQGAA